MTEEGPRVALEDNDDGKGQESAPAAQEGTEQGENEKSAEGKKSFAPRQYGDAVGGKMESVMAPVGKPLGKGLETIASPVGGLVDPLVGGINRGGAAFGAVTGVGAGNMEHKNREEQEELHKPYGGKEQTGDNPLGL
ncbi:hypothetical protein G7Y79_00038g075280 [Physcia stellaris]|nr:hypothetical protein G7Y79_00038g075280 [Physcia stellaris]